MSVHQSNIAMLRALRRSFAAKSRASGQFALNADLMGRMAVSFEEAADDLERQEAAQREKLHG
jgi:hypothetical protein